MPAQARSPAAAGRFGCGTCGAATTCLATRLDADTLAIPTLCSEAPDGAGATRELARRGVTSQSALDVIRAALLRGVLELELP